MPHKQAGADTMSTTLVLIIVGGLLAAGLFIASRWKRYRIRQTGTMVMANVTEVRSWQDMLARADYSLQKTMPPFVNGRWRYEISAEWIDPNTWKSYVFTSDIKNGLSPARHISSPCSRWYARCNGNRRSSVTCWPLFAPRASMPIFNSAPAHVAPWRSIAPAKPMQPSRGAITSNRMT